MNVRRSARRDSGGSDAFADRPFARRFRARRARKGRSRLRSLVMRLEVGMCRVRRRKQPRAKRRCLLSMSGWRATTTRWRRRRRLRPSKLPLLLTREACMLLIFLISEEDITMSTLSGRKSAGRIFVWETLSGFEETSRSLLVNLHGSVT